ncbi:MAG: gamma-glutamylcyclotransferase [Rhodospirillaceae bacterium]|jgi:cation transport protein ChaC
MTDRIEISRELVQSGELERIVKEYEREGNFTLMDPDERDATRHRLLADLTEDEDVWLFAYGSLIWNPTIEFLEKRAGTLHGFHRQFCLKTLMGRGTPDNPGLTLALEPGGECCGILFRVAAAEREQELKIVWGREMLSGAYRPQWVEVETEQETVRAIAFTMNHDYPNYTGPLPEEHIVNTMATAIGPLGGCWEYLFQTCEHLADNDLDDSHLTRLRELTLAHPGFIGRDQVDRDGI